VFGGSEPVLFVVAVAFGIGAGLLMAGVLRVQRRLSTRRRVADILDLEQPTEPTVAAEAPRDLRESVQGLAAFARRHDTALRYPLLIVAFVSGLVGVGTLSFAWIALAALAAAGAYGLGARLRRQQALEAQALEAIQLLSSGLRAGYSVPQAITLVARNSPEPTASEFGLASQEIGLGVDLAESLSRLGKRNANPDYTLVAIIVGVQHEVGGNLAHILDSVTSTLRERIELRRHVDALTAQQRLSSVVLTLLPFALLTFLFVMDRSFVEPLFSEFIGRILLVLSAVMVLVGWTVMRSIGRVEA
jgi:tight adherence protein B